MMAFQMKIKDIFRIGDKTVFTGKLDTQMNTINDASCVIEIDGKPVGALCIQGEVYTGTPHRDLWTKSFVNLTHEVIRNHDVWLISA
jgi:hypothetical protein